MSTEAPERIRVCIRAGKEEWIGVAYAAETDDPSKIHSYVREDLAQEREKHFPKIICLCGSTRFVDTWVNEYQRLSDEGNIVLTVARMPPRPNLQNEEPALKARLDGLHLRKIDLADEVFVLNVGGYTGDSTKREIEYAKSKNKVVKFLVEIGADF